MQPPIRCGIHRTRGGFNLDGIRIATESHPTNRSVPGSPVLNRDFENRVGGTWV